MHVEDGITIFGTHDENTLTQIKDVASRCDRAALMADGHIGYIMPIGGVAAYDNQVSVAGVGFDIACGNCAIRTNITLEKLTDISHLEIDQNPYRLQSNGRLNELADWIKANISFGIGRVNKEEVLAGSDPFWYDPGWFAIPSIARDDLQLLASRQLGTVGSGNHYVDVLVDENGVLWVGVHFGSRGLGHKIASNVMALSVGNMWGQKTKEVEALMDINAPLGQAYWAMMTMAGRYAYLGREWVTRKVIGAFGGTEEEMVHNHHNFAWKETHFDKELIVVRKGATPAMPGQRGFVGGSMGDDAVILRGATPLPDGDNSFINRQEAALYSTVHGAGRVMSRTEAAGKRDRKTGRLKLDTNGVPKKMGKVSEKEMKSWLDKRGVILRGAGLDESPQAYRRLPDVLSEQGETVEVLHTLRPIIVAMAGANEFDPYRD